MHKSTEINFVNAKKLRKEATEAEVVLWKSLKGRNFLNLKFRRQHPIDNYIVDFFCHELQLVIEVDGKYHSTPEQKVNDEQRTKFLHEIGVSVLRLTNEEVLSIDSALNKIELFIKTIKIPSPLGEG